MRTGRVRRIEPFGGRQSGHPSINILLLFCMKELGAQGPSAGREGQRAGGGGLRAGCAGAGRRAAACVHARFGGAPHLQAASDQGPRAPQTELQLGWPVSS